MVPLEEENSFWKIWFSGFMRNFGGEGDMFVHVSGNFEDGNPNKPAPKKLGLSAQK